MLIVGACVAGASVAALLGDAGYRVLLVDRGSFPSPTLSTHFFRERGMVDVLHRLQVLDQVLTLGSPPLTQSYDYPNGDDRPIITPVDPNPIDYHLAVRRKPIYFHTRFDTPTTGPSPSAHPAGLLNLSC